MTEYRARGDDLDWVPFDLQGARSSIQNATSRVAALVRTSADPTIRAHSLEWTVGETAAHLVVVARANAEYARGSNESVIELDRLAETNRARIDELTERDVHRLADALEAAVEELLMTTAGRSPTELQPWHSRTRLALGGMLGIFLAELLLHGRDIAQTEHVRWPIEDSDAVHVVRGGLAFCPLVLDRELARTRPTTYRLRCRGVPTSIWRFEDGALAISEDHGDKVDCQVRTDAVTFMLLGFGRISPIAAALRGRALGWGRRPFAAFRVPSYFVAG